MDRLISIINITFFIELVFIILIALGIMPRDGALFLALFLPAIIIIVPLEDAVFFIARSIPLFLALPITESFDNFNIWRIILLTAFLKLVISQKPAIINSCKAIFTELKKPVSQGYIFLRQNYKIESLIIALLFFSALSLFNAEDVPAGIKRIIYFTNIAMLFFVTRYTINQDNLTKLGKNFVISGIIASAVGVIQLVSAYLSSIDNFAQYWAFVVERNLYGDAWAGIAISANTWFAYFNNTIHLRVFSSFPDSHSFPTYLMIISIFIASFIALKKSQSASSKSLYFLLGIFSLLITLSGTRGIWAAIIAPIAIIAIYYFKKSQTKPTIAILSLPIILFILSLIISQPIFSSKQFILTENKSGDQVLINRLISIFDTEETSNKGRIYIWEESIKSITRNPIFGVGIGNFPTVLKQDISLAKAGSTAHNLFLHILAEVGIFAFAVFLIIIHEIYQKAKTLSENSDVFIKFFGLFSILYIFWILTYNMTDPIIFDERVFMASMILIGSIYGVGKTIPKKLQN